MSTDVDLSKATPRPWVNDAPGCIGKHYDKGGKKTVLMAPQEDEEGRANAALATIAVNEYEAAAALIRSMREALISSRYYIKDYAISDGGFDECEIEIRTDFDAVEDAIARADLYLAGQSGISREPGETSACIDWKHVDGPLLVDRGHLHWLTWGERFLLMFGLTSIQDIVDRRFPPGGVTK